MRRGPASGSGGVLASAPPRPPPPKPPPSFMLRAIFGVSFPSLGAAGTCAAASGPSAAGANPAAPRISMAVLRENFMSDSILDRTENSAYHSRLPTVYPQSQRWGGPPGPRPTPCRPACAWLDAAVVVADAGRGVRPQRGPQDQGVRPTASAAFAVTMWHWGSGTRALVASWYHRLVPPVHTMVQSADMKSEAHVRSHRYCRSLRRGVRRISATSEER